MAQTKEQNHAPAPANASGEKRPRMDALLYQAGCCRIDGGGMYLVGAPAGPAAPSSPKRLQRPSISIRWAASAKWART